MKTKIQNEEPADHSAIDAVIRAAFEGDGEGILVRKLRRDTDLIMSLVARGLDGNIVAHLAMSRMLISGLRSGSVDNMPVAALAPVAVKPELQNQGIGSELIKEAMTRLTEQGESVILVLGHKDYYERFGFRVELAKNIDHPFPADSFMAIELKPGALEGVAGKVKYPRAFGLAPEWTRE